MAHTNLGMVAGQLLTATLVNRLLSDDGSGNWGFGVTAPGSYAKVFINGTSANNLLGLGNLSDISDDVIIYSRSTGKTIFSNVAGGTFEFTPGMVGVGKTPIRIFDVEGSLSGQYAGGFYNTSATGHGLYVKGGAGSLYNALTVDNQAGTGLFSIDGNGLATFRNTSSAIAQIALNAGYTSLENGNYITVTVNTGGIISVSVYIPAWGYVSGLFYAEYQSATIVKLADPSGKFEVNTDIGSTISLYKGGGGGLVYVKNRTGDTADRVSVNVIDMQGN